MMHGQKNIKKIEYLVVQGCIIPSEGGVFIVITFCLNPR